MMANISRDNETISRESKQAHVSPKHMQLVASFQSLGSCAFIALAWWRPLYA